MKSEPAAADLPQPAEAVTPAARPSTIHSLQLLRFVAALMVVLFHSYIAGRGGDEGMEATLINRLFGLGASGVHVFFVISGFVMVFTSFGPRGVMRPATFIKRRLIRIYPIYWVIALAYLAAHQALGTAYDLTPGQIFGAFALWPELSAKIIGPGWTLSYEMYFYLAFALMLFLPARLALPALSAAFTVSIALGFLFTPASPELHLATNSLLLEFLVGCWLAHAYLRGLRLPHGSAVAMVLLSILLFAAGVIFGHQWLPSIIVWGVPSMVLVAGIISLESWFADNPIARFFAKLGDGSYFLYLCHILVIDLVTAVVGEPGAGVLWRLVAFAVLTAMFVALVAEVGHRTIEKPLLRLLRSRQSKAPITSAKVPASEQA